jgi:hypothetical protein
VREVSRSINSQSSKLPNQLFNIFSKIFIWQTCNALFVIRVVLTHWIRLEKEASLIRKFTVQTPDTGTESLLENLAVQLIEILVDIPLKYYLNIDFSDFFSPVLAYERPAFLSSYRA